MVIIRALLMGVFALSFASADDVVAVAQGRLRGTSLVSRRGITFKAFKGIPYAQPPLGELRFRPPADPGPWSGVLDASEYGPDCIQKDVFFEATPTVRGQEDCLTLNVFTHQANEGAGAPVMVWFHGGGWQGGAGSWYGPEYLMDENIVLVTVNYRLGPLGFLSTEDEACPGNFGLKDQVMSLRWVKYNIAAFGGDPGAVTIFGQSAGAASVHYHLLSPLSAGLFHRAISQSGTALDVWARTRDARSKAKKLGNLLRCPIDSSEALIGCLRGKDAVEIFDVTDKFLEWNKFPIIAFGPVVEKTGLGSFIHDFPYRLTKSGEFHPVPWVVGNTANEGAILITDLMTNASLLEEMSERFEEVAPIALDFTDVEAKGDISHAIRRFYFGYNPLLNKETIHQMEEMFTDRFSAVALDRAVRLHSSAKTAPVYLYHLTHRGAQSAADVLGATEDLGVSHCDDLQYLFNISAYFQHPVSEDEDQRIIDKMVSMWTNFARTGNPTPDVKELNVTWNSLEVSEDQALTFLKIDKSLQMSSYLRGAGVRFWNSLPVNERQWRLSETHERDEL